MAQTIEKREMKIGMVVFPIARGLKASAAASIGRAITRYSYLQWIQQRVLCLLLEMSVKQARIIITIPQYAKYSSSVRELLAFQKIDLQFNFTKLANTLRAAEKARNELAHSIILKDGKKFRIQLVRSKWENVPEDHKPVYRAIVPEGPYLDAIYLRVRRKDIEAGIKILRLLQRKVEASLKTLHSKRTRQTSLDRRVRGRTRPIATSP